MIVVLSLIVTGVWSVTVAGARVSAVSSVDLGLYSLFGQYDKDFMEHFGLLFVDGGAGEADLQMGRIYHELEGTVDYNLFAESFTSEMRPAVNQGTIEGYTLATDGGGSIFKEQVIEYMKETLGAQGVQALLEKVQSESETVKKQEEDKTKIDSGDIEDYEAVKQAAEEARALAEEEANENDDMTVLPPVEETEVVNPIEIIKTLKEMGTLTLLIPQEEQLSRKEIDLTTVVSQRTLQQGMGVIPSSNDNDGITNEFLFQEYLLSRCGSYTNPVAAAALEYQVEYILQGKSSDIENLKGVANRLLLIREAANVLHLIADSEKKAQASGMALAISTAIGMPQAAQVVEGVLIACWAFGESVIDVRALFRGEKVPLIKTGNSWQLSLDQLANLPQLLNGEMGGSDKGLDYQGYLRILLLLKKSEEKVMRTMDAAEMTMRGVGGRENFRMDSCLFSIDVKMQIGIWQNTYYISRSYGYDM